MAGLSRRNVMKLAASTGVAAAALGGLDAHAQQDQEAADKENPNSGLQKAVQVQEVDQSSAAAAAVGTYLFAVVNSAGTLARHRFAISSKKLGTGQYEVIFLFDVRRAAYLATIGLSGSVGASASGEITVVGRVTDARGVYIETRNSAGVLQDRGFHLGVLLP